MSFLEMMDVLNDRLIREGKDPVAFDHDCREGICGMCSMYINGRAHGPLKGTTTCQLHMRHFSDGETVTIEPWRAEAFPVIKDPVVDRTAFDKIIAAGGYISANTGNALTPTRFRLKGEGGRSLRRGCLHRLRRLRGVLQERFRHAVPLRKTSPGCAAAAGRTRRRERVLKMIIARRIRLLAAAPTPAPAKRNVRVFSISHIAG